MATNDNVNNAEDNKPVLLNKDTTPGTNPRPDGEALKLEENKPPAAKDTTPDPNLRPEGGEALKAEENKLSSGGDALKSEENKPKPEGEALKPEENKPRPEGEALKPDENKPPAAKDTTPDPNLRPEGEALKSEEDKSSPGGEALKTEENKPRLAGETLKPEENKPRPGGEALKPEENKPSATKDTTSDPNLRPEGEALKEEDNKPSPGGDALKPKQNNSKPECEPSKPVENKPPTTKDSSPDPNLRLEGEALKAKENKTSPEGEALKPEENKPSTAKDASPDTKLRPEGGALTAEENEPSPGGEALKPEENKSRPEGEALKIEENIPRLEGEALKPEEDKPPPAAAADSKPTKSVRWCEELVKESPVRRDSYEDELLLQRDFGNLSSNPYVNSSPAPSDNISSLSFKLKDTMSTVKDMVGTWGRKVGETTKKAEDLAGNTWQHLKLNPSLADAALCRIAHGTKVLVEGGYEKIFTETFKTVNPEERLVNTFACYMSTSCGPVVGVMYLSTERLAFVSDNPISYRDGANTEWSYYKVVIPLHQIKAVKPSTSKTSPAEKYIQVVSFDHHEFWYLGFINYSAAVECLQETIQAPNVHSV